MVNLLKIKDLAKSKKITLNDVAERLGMTPQALSRMIKDNSTKVTTLESLCELFNVPIGYFFDSSTELPNTQQLGGEPMESKEKDVARLSDSERAELEILRERVHSLVIARDALIDQVNLLKEKVENLTNENYGKKSTK